MEIEKIADINKNIPHKVTEVFCWLCGERWIAVRPEKTLLKKIECPNCKTTGYVIETGEEMGEDNEI